ncbi:MAG: hypothetical protein AAF633_06315 [Chloroflexota bacterium]
MSTHHHHRRSRYLMIVGLTIFILSSLALFPTVSQGQGLSPTPFSQTPYAACIRDNGDPVEPLPFARAWSVLLTFDHAPSSTHTEACWAIRDQNLNIWYRAGIQCDLINNVNNAQVGLSSATFDGHFHIECPKRSVTSLMHYNAFFVHVNASIPQANGYYPVVSHPDFHVHLKRNQTSSGGWVGSIHSTIGGVAFEHHNEASSLLTGPTAFNAVVRNGIAYHQIEQSTSKTTSINPFTVDMTQGIEIGGGDAPWTIYELIIDPPEMCAANC